MADFSSEAGGLLHVSANYPVGAHLRPEDAIFITARHNVKDYDAETGFIAISLETAKEFRAELTRLINECEARHADSMGV